MTDKGKINIFWFRRDLRVHDNAGLYYALKSGRPVLCLFIFDTKILDKLPAKEDARVTFIFNEIGKLKGELEKHHSSLIIKYNTPDKAWDEVLSACAVSEVYTNHDYEPYADRRDKAIADKLSSNGIAFKTYKDQVIFEKNEVTKDDGLPYTVFTPYKNRWRKTVKPFYLKPYPTQKYLKNLHPTQALPSVTLKQMGFVESSLEIPPIRYKDFIADYAKTRDYPGIDGTSRIGIHLRFGTVSIRQAVNDAMEAHEKTWLNELIWREFYMMILHHFPHTTDHAFRPEYDRIKWINDEDQFQAWCEGRTGIPLVDAGMRQLNATGFMHNRIRMVTASYLSKNLLIDWRWGERYFADRLLDYELASNVGGWQWAAGSGTDAAPYFRIFSPDAQTKRFDPKLDYIKKWVPEYGDFSRYPKPIVDHAFARERCLKVYKAALSR